jgi:hypothetical protein
VPLLCPGSWVRIGIVQRWDGVVRVSYRSVSFFKWPKLRTYNVSFRNLFNGLLVR